MLRANEKVEEIRPFIKNGEVHARRPAVVHSLAAPDAPAHDGARAGAAPGGLRAHHPARHERARLRWYPRTGGAWRGRRLDATGLVPDDAHRPEGAGGSGALSIAAN